MRTARTARTARRPFPVLIPLAAAVLVLGGSAPVLAAARRTAAAPRPATTPRTAGSLDPAFGWGGSIVVPRAGISVDPVADARVAVGPTGRIFVLSYRNSTERDQRVELRTFTASGVLDRSFRVATPTLVTDSRDPACCVTGGPFPTADGGVTVAYGFVRSSHVLRFNANGSIRWSAMMPDYLAGMTQLDDGSPRSITLDVFGPPTGPPPLTLRGLLPTGAADSALGPDGALALTQQAGGQAIVRDAANRVYVVGNAYGFGGFSDRSIDARRFSSSGVEDASYGVGGVGAVTLEPDDATPGSLAALVDAVAVAPDGSLFLAGEHRDDSGVQQVIVHKLGPDGIVAADFGNGGWLDMAAPSGSSRLGGLWVDRAGRVLVSFVDQGASADTAYLARLDPATGALDPTFGHTGLIATTGQVTGLATTATNQLITVSRELVGGDAVLTVSRRTS